MGTPFHGWRFEKVQVCKPAFQTAFTYIVGQFFGKLSGKAEIFLLGGNLQTCTFPNCFFIYIFIYTAGIPVPWPVCTPSTALPLRKGIFLPHMTYT